MSEHSSNTASTPLKNNHHTCNLDNLEAYGFQFSNNFLGFCSEAIAYALSANEHPSGICIAVDGNNKCSLEVEWSFAISSKISNGFGDTDRAAEYGAYLISFFQIGFLTEYQVTSTAKKGGGFDFWLAPKMDPLNFKGRLEVSGLFNGSSAQLANRVKQKTQQISRATSLCSPRLISVTNFGVPISRFDEVAI